MKKLNIFCILSLAAPLCGLLVGCGGSGSSSSNPGQTINTTGGITTTTGQSTTPGATSTSPQQVQVTLSNGNSVAAMVPPGQPAFTTASTLCIIPSGVPIIVGLTPGQFQRRTTTPNAVNISYDKGATWQYTGVNFDASGSLSQNLALVAPVLAGVPNDTKCYLEAVGPLTLVGSNDNGAKLTIQQLVFGLAVDSSGVASLPATMTLSLPANNGLTTSNNSANVTYPQPDYSSGSASLLFTWPGITRSQSNPVTAGSVNFEGPSNSSPIRIPSNGVTTVEYLFTQP